VYRGHRDRCKETGERGEAEHQGRLPTGEIRSRLYQVFDRLLVQVSGEVLSAFGRTPH
jgi:hypothetical protein